MKASKLRQVIGRVSTGLKPSALEARDLAHRELREYAAGLGRPVTKGKFLTLVIVIGCLALSIPAQMIRLARRALGI